jgi:phosphoglycolate phosphatase-like HAD superfamily hydrolase
MLLGYASYMAGYIKPHIKVVLFDHDDTLVATYKAKWAEHKYVARTYYGRELTDNDIRPHWGKPLRELMCLLYGTDDADQALAYNRQIHTNFPKILHDDTIATLTRLKQNGRKLGVITATHRASFSYDLAHFNIPEDLLDFTQTEDDTSFHKPDPRVFDPVLQWLAKEKIAPSNVLYVGDGLHDMRAAFGAGFEFIGITTGLVTRDEFIRHGVIALNKLSELSGT